MPNSIIPTLMVDIEGIELSLEDKELLQHPLIAGLTLFARNYQNSAQLLALTESILTLNPHLIIAVDQEGGRVQRFQKDFTKLPPLAYWGKLYEENEAVTLLEVEKIARLMASELKQHQINFSFAPVLDLNYQHNEVIGERSFHRSPEIVTALGRAFITGLHEEKMIAVGKHFPGHGHVTSDSHTDLPVDERDFNSIFNSDLIPFFNLSQELDALMLAHVIYSKIDNLPSTFSPVWIKKVLRQQLHFKGIVFTDDLNMAAARHFGSFESCAVEALEAGCDFLLICNNRKGVVSTVDFLEKRAFSSDQKLRINRFIEKFK